MFNMKAPYSGFHGNLDITSVGYCTCWIIMKRWSSVSVLAHIKCSSRLVRFWITVVYNVNNFVYFIIGGKQIAFMD